MARSVVLLRDRSQRACPVAATVSRAAPGTAPIKMAPLSAMSTETRVVEITRPVVVRLAIRSNVFWVPPSIVPSGRTNTAVQPLPRTREGAWVAGGADGAGSLSVPLASGAAFASAGPLEVPSRFETVAG